MAKLSVNHEEVAWRVVDDEAVVIHNTTTFYYGLNKTGTYIWNLIAETPQSSEDITSKVSAHFGKNSNEVSKEIEELLRQLKEEALIIERE